MIRNRCGLAHALLACGLLAWGCTPAGGGGKLARSRHDAGVSLSPDPAYASAQIAVVLDDPQLQSAQCRYRWRRNGVQIVDAEGSALDPRHFSRGDEIAVTVNASNPASGVVRTLKATVRVANTPPKVTRITLLPATDSGTPLLQASFESVDQDRDELSYACRWFKNDVLIDGASGPSLPLARIARGDRVTVEVVAHDAESASAPMRSDPFTLENQPPQFTSQPIAPKPADTEFHYQAVAADPDRDPLRYELVSGPDGMTVDPAGSTYWRLPTGPLRSGSFPVRLRAIDSLGGEATQDFTISLDPPAAKPAAKPQAT
jgi:hypothetical protein